MLVHQRVHQLERYQYNYTIYTLDIIRYMCTWTIWIGYQPLTIPSMHYQVPAGKANCSRNGSPQALQPTVLVSEKLALQPLYSH